MSSEPIDAVYTWIDASDLGRSKEREEWLSHLDVTESSRRLPFPCKKKKLTELYFSLQSLKKFAPWIRRVFIVTQRPQSPEWLSEYPRASVVFHDQIFGDAGHLPTFSSRAIEANLHRIPGLSEAFIYFNDDMFLGQPMEPGDFFRDIAIPNTSMTSTLRPILRTLKPWVPLQTSADRTVFMKNREEVQTVIQKKDNAYVNSNRRVHIELNKTFVFDPLRPNIAHQATPLTRQLLQEAEAALPSEWENIQRQKFRSSSTLTPIPYALFRGLYTGKVVVLPKSKDRVVQVWESASRDSKLIRKIQSLKPHLFCVNDMGPHMSDAEAQVYWKGLFQYYSK